MSRVFVFTAFAVAALSFWMQPLFAKMLLPYLGGAPAVWTTCMVFFQCALLCGYTAARFQALHMSAAVGAVTHAGLLVAAAFLFLPFRPPEAPNPAEIQPVLWLLMTLTTHIGAPFVLLSAATILVQNWSAALGSRRPSRLYAAGAMGSFAGLLGFPFFWEPLASLKAQAYWWSAGFVVCALACGVIAAVLPRGARTSGVARESSVGPGFAQRLRWIVLAAAPAALLQSATLHLSADIAAVPLLWIVPLGLYLLTFVWAFGRKTDTGMEFLPGFQALSVIAALVVVYWFRPENRLWTFPFTLIALFATGMLCHFELAQSRPRDADRIADPVGGEASREPTPGPDDSLRDHTGHMPEFYLMIALGGALGGAFCSLAAPFLFTSTAEFPISLMAAALIAPVLMRSKGNPAQAGPDIIIAIAVIPTLTILLWALQNRLGVDLIYIVTYPLAVGLGAATFTFREKPVRFGAGLIALFVLGQSAGAFEAKATLETLHKERNFFGILKAQYDKQARWIALTHGTTVHGSQFTDPDRRREPTCYHAQNGPLGDVFAALPSFAGNRTVAVAGLGAGAMAAYGRPGEHWTFYEIDPAVEKFARNSEYFTFLKESAAHVEVVVGDARLRLAQAPDQFFHLIALDAFSSDAVPVHLLTREAMELYQRKSAPGGVVVFNITNRYLEFEPVIAEAAHALGIQGLFREDEREEKIPGRCNSKWAVLSANSKFIARLAAAPGWRTLGPPGRTELWTDDYSNIVGALKLWGR